MCGCTPGCGWQCLCRWCHPERRRQFEDDVRADTLADIARDEDMDHALASLLDGEA